MDILIEKVNAERMSIFPIGEDGTMIYDQETEKTHLLNETAAYLYGLIEDKPLMLDEIVRLFKEKYVFDENSSDELEEDLIEVLDMFSDRGLIVMRRIDV